MFLYNLQMIASTTAGSDALSDFNQNVIDHHCESQWIRRHLLSLNANADSLSLCSRSSPSSRPPDVVSSSPPLLLPPRGSNIGAHRALIVGVQNIGTLPYLLLAFLAPLPSPSPSPSMRAFPHPERTNLRIRPPPPPSSSSSSSSPGPSTRSSPFSSNSIRC